ncbi:MAG: maleylpyruvate isomerase family mycothiol-dependent enzyme [Nocardioides sp.]|uniref:maleylpyruvate isomerase family mycothiol-dependent enzyme n=1 Tax=Nocardioides sp. TaxID=35761 RepID=UPI003F1143C2
MSELSRYVDTWWSAVEDFTHLVEEIPAESWALPTDLPGWDVHAVVAHIAHLEALLAGADHDDVAIGEADHVRSPMGQFTEQGVVARRGASRDDLVNEIRESTTARHTALLADPPTDPEAPAPGLFGALGWSTRTLLSNRPLDLWMHEQDVRRAVGVPGGLDSAGAAHVTDVFLASLPYVVAKRAALPTGTTVVVEVVGHDPVAATVGEDGRGQRLAEVPTDPTVRLRADRAAYTRMAGGRGRPTEGFEVSGDAELGERLLSSLAVTP